ncbi:Transposon TX1 uncharacterized protein [Nymphaea thermarum]|nr:Transposon TX1 uncharacterized protein [Nymphaea thermarum]
MSSIISPFQVALIKGRRLQDAVVLANEVVYFFYCLRLPSFILKLDISKVFDSVSWEFLSDLLTRFVFGPSFRQWVMSLVTGAQLVVSFNGKCGDFFCLERGLRHGCPLLPLLFNLVAESFSALFHHATAVGFLTPHSLFHLQNFSNLQNADDFLLFGNAFRQQIVRTWLILRVFELISGLSINFAKCQLSLIHADPATILLAEACFGCKASSLPMEYLGLQITLSPPAPSFWNGMEQKLNDRLQFLLLKQNMKMGGDWAGYPTGESIDSRPTAAAGAIVEEDCVSQKMVWKHRSRREGCAAFIVEEDGVCQKMVWKHRYTRQGDAAFIVEGEGVSQKVTALLSSEKPSDPVLHHDPRSAVNACHSQEASAASSFNSWNHQSDG